MADKGLSKLEKQRLKEKEQFEKEREKWKKAEAKKRKKKSKKRDSAAILIKTIAIVITAAIVLSVAGIYSSNYGIPGRFWPALTVGDTNISAPVWAFNFYYIYQQMHQYGQYIGLDTATTAFGQLSGYTDDSGSPMTWDEYFRKQVNVSLQNEIALYTEAVNNGVTLDEDTKAELDEQMKTLKEQATSNAMSINAYLHASYVPGITEKVYREIQERSSVVQQYEQMKRDEFRANHPESEQREIYDEDPSAYDYVDFRVYVFEKEELKAATGETDAQLAMRQVEADQALVKEAESFLRNARTEQRFIDEVSELLEAKHEHTEEETEESHDFDTQADEGTLYTQYNKESLVSTFTEEDFAAWFFDAARAAGNTTTWETDDNVFAVYLVRPAYAQNTVDFYTINIEIDTTAEDGDAAAKKSADDLLAKWKEKGSTKEAFTELVKAQADALAAEEGTEPGLTEKAGPGVSGVDEMDDWLFDTERKAGEATVIATSSSYKVVYLSSINADHYTWMTTISDELVEKDYEAFVLDLQEKYPLGYHGIGTRFAMQYAQQMCDTYMTYAMQQQYSY